MLCTLITLPLKLASDLGWAVWRAKALATTPFIDLSSDGSLWPEEDS